ncbi:Major facilitator superfamily domain general substrate transporter [Penicillium cf. griseofulvum]|uniref:Major facilitator superfamily domain general substrate transporter n=1 Tax=Penicillium cf. griseofulvum TaxID=2972120 RepID=A0A9W9J2J9_9EURO|nr:Major facilitator superfamily domain general substrate transporter [Penicillium cf. griseofulvum]KAJ5422978.1 Major facilitator superfamily domain general substrate transporter [Penicillium cf. griseofulvum]KAJ5433806.1 Major facilitator superfamily domain general substrate transporter [Penicillium cf. griseofulvum]
MTETQPLLGSHAKPAQHPKKLLICIVCTIFLLSADFGFFMSAAPQIAVYEDIICRNYQANLHGVGNDTLTPPVSNPCKSEAVQGELALVIGYQSTLDVIPGLVLALPYGVLSDHWGRKPFLYLSILGIILGEIWVRIVCLWSSVIPLRMVWMSAVFKIIGGGDQVLMAIAMVIVAEVFSEDERATALFRLQSCIQIAEILATPLSAYLMSFGPMFPYLLSIFIIIVGSIPALFLPETLKHAKEKQVNQESSEQNDESAQSQPSSKRTVLQEITRQVREFVQSTRFIWTDSNICLMVFVMFVTVMSRQCTNLLLQYVSKKFDWSISRASLLISLRGIFALVTYLAIMPILAFLAAKYLNLHGKHSDHFLSKGSGVLSIIGFTVIFIAPTPAILIGGQVISSIGSSFMITTRSLATSLVQPDHAGTLYSAIAIAQGLGTVVSGPLFANLFRLGMRLGPAWMGLPFLQASVFFVFAVTALWHIRLGRSPRANDEEQEQEPLLFQ